jgi:hypothetical protein
LVPWPLARTTTTTTTVEAKRKAAPRLALLPALSKTLEMTLSARDSTHTPFALVAGPW